MEGLTDEQESLAIRTNEAEWRMSSIYVRTADASAIYPIDPIDVHDEISRQIIETVQSLVQRGEKVNPVNIRDTGKIPATEISRRLEEYDPFWIEDAPTYVQQIQAEGFRTRELKVISQRYHAMNKASWRTVEEVHAKTIQDVTAVRVGGVGGKEDEAGYIFEHITDEPIESMEPLPLPWPWVNAMIKGGMFPFKKYCFAGPPGQRKTSALFCAMHYAVVVNGKQWVHFPFDGGSVKEQTLKFFVVHWMYLTIQSQKTGHPVSPTCTARVLHGGNTLGTIENYLYINTIVALQLLYGKDTGCQFPPGAMDLFNQARREMAALQSGRGPGRLVMVSASTVGGDVYRVAQRLRNELLGEGGVDAWSLDHVSKPTNRFTDELGRHTENTRVLTSFTDLEGPPCILLSQLAADGYKVIGQDDVNPHLKFNTKLFEDVDGLFMFKYNGEVPDRLMMIAQKNREGKGGPKAHYPLRVQPDTGYIWDDPKMLQGAARVQPTSKRLVEEEYYGDEEDNR